MKLKKLANNFTKLENEVTGVNIYFSYETPIAFELGSELTIRQNDWKQATGTHLNSVNEDKFIRVSGAQFEEQLKEMLLK